MYKLSKQSACNGNKFDKTKSLKTRHLHSPKRSLTRERLRDRTSFLSAIFPNSSESIFTIYGLADIRGATIWVDLFNCSCIGNSREAMTKEKESCP